MLSTLHRLVVSSCVLLTLGVTFCDSGGRAMFGADKDVNVVGSLVDAAELVLSGEMPELEGVFRILQAVALGELSAGAARDVTEALVVTVSTGLNAAVIVRGAVLPAPARIADEYGHRPLPAGLLADPRTDPACGRTCFHANASGLSVYARARAAGLEFAENRDFDRLAEAGDARALELYEQEGRLLAEWLGPILMERGFAEPSREVKVTQNSSDRGKSVSHPLVVWQGTFARRGFNYFEWALRDGLSQLVGKVPEFRLGELGDNAGLVGASYLR